MIPFELQKYLRKNPPLPLSLHGASAAAVIPLYDELQEFPAAWKTIENSLAAFLEPVAVIAVVNEPAGADAASSREMLDFLSRFPRITPLYLPQLSGGVGAARKAGMDAALAAAAEEGIPLSRLVLLSLDGDTHLEASYFSSVIPAVRTRGGALTIGFRHRTGATAEEEKAIRRYEAYLERYVSRLAWAGSPYAFFTIGSAFAVRGDAYLRAGGMRVREAGEDFYFLQAAAKRGGVSRYPEILLHPSARVSHRVPFGTGPAVGKLLAGEELAEIPDPAFSLLKTLLLAVKEDASLKESGKLEKSLPPAAAAFLKQERFFLLWPEILRNTPDRADARQKAFHDWFDGLKTLRFLHWAESNGKNA